jgi:hypothetical protein
MSNFRQNRRLKNGMSPAKEVTNSLPNSFDLPRKSLVCRPHLVENFQARSVIG